MKLFIRFIVAGVLLGVPPWALAVDVQAQQITSIITTLFDTTSGLASHSPYVDDGRRLFRYLLVILISWSGIQVLFADGGFQAVIARLIKIILMASICLFFMTSEVQQSVVKSFDAAAVKAVSATGSSVSIENPADAVLSVLQSGGSAILKLWHSNELPTPPSEISDADKSEFQKAQNWIRGIASAMSMDLVMHMLVTVLGKVATTLAMVIALGTYLVVLVMSQILVNIGLIVAPLFIPWLLWEGTSFLFNGWLKFMITTGLQKIVGALLLGLTYQMMDAVQALALQASTTPVYDFLAYSFSVLIMLMMAMLIWQVPAIANGLVSGMPSTNINIPRGNSGGGGKGGNAPPPGNPRPPPPNRPQPNFQTSNRSGGQK